MRYHLGQRRPVPRDLRRLIALGRKACERNGWRLPKLRVVWRDSIEGSDGYARIGTTSYAAGVVTITLTPQGDIGDTVAHEMAHAVLEPILTARASHHSALWAVVYGALYRALVDGA